MIYKYKFNPNYEQINKTTVRRTYMTPDGCTHQKCYKTTKSGNFKASDGSRLPVPVIEAIIDEQEYTNLYLESYTNCEAILDNMGCSIEHYLKNDTQRKYANLIDIYNDDSHVPSFVYIDNHPTMEFLNKDLEPVSIYKMEDTEIIFDFYNSDISDEMRGFILYTIMRRKYPEAFV